MLTLIFIAIPLDVMDCSPKSYVYCLKLLISTFRCFLCLHVGPGVTSPYSLIGNVNNFQ